MKHAFKVLLAAIMISAPIAASADVDFESMPIGCSWSVKYSDGKTLVETFKGKKSGKYITETADKRSPDKLVSRTTFDKKGRMIRKDWAVGKWETFKPFSCFSTLGMCSYSYTNGDGNDFIIDNTVTKQGKGFKVVAGPRGGTPYSDDYYQLGRFNLQVMHKNDNYSDKLIGFSNCDSVS